VTISVIQRLRLAAATLPAGRVPVKALLDAHGSATHGTVLALFAIPCLLPLPGVDIVLGMGIAAVAGQMMGGLKDVHLPARVAAFELPRHIAQRVMELLARFYDIGGRWTRERLGHFTGGPYRWLVATTTALMAVLLVLPIPLGDFLPALALIVLGFGLVFRDGAAVLLAFATAAVAILFNLAVVVIAWRFVGAWLMEWIPGLAT
jgi:hypothetical protein